MRSGRPPRTAGTPRSCPSLPGKYIPLLPKRHGISFMFLVRRRRRCALCRCLAALSCIGKTHERMTCSEMYISNSLCPFNISFSRSPKDYTQQHPKSALLKEFHLPFPSHSCPHTLRSYITHLPRPHESRRHLPIPPAQTTRYQIRHPRALLGERLGLYVGEEFEAEVFHFEESDAHDRGCR